MIVPIQDILGLVFNEYINLDNALKISKSWDDIIYKLPEERKTLFQKKKRNWPTYQFKENL